MQQFWPVKKWNKWVFVPWLAEHTTQGKHAGSEVGSGKRVLLCSEFLLKHECNLPVLVQRSLAGNLPRLQYDYFTKPQEHPHSD